MQFFLFLALILVIVFAVFVLQNPAVITLKLITWSFTGPLAFIFAIVFGAGILAGTFLFIPTWWKKARTGRLQRRRIQELEEEIMRSTGEVDMPVSGEE